jgi:hypothetical protein
MYPEGWYTGGPFVAKINAANFPHIFQVIPGGDAEAHLRLGAAEIDAYKAARPAMRIDGGPGGKDVVLLGHPDAPKPVVRWIPNVPEDWDTFPAKSLPWPDVGPVSKVGVALHVPYVEAALDFAVSVGATIDVRLYNELSPTLWLYKVGNAVVAMDVLMPLKYEYHKFLLASLGTGGVAAAKVKKGKGVEGSITTGAELHWLLRRVLEGSKSVDAMTVADGSTWWYRQLGTGPYARTILDAPLPHLPAARMQAETALAWSRSIGDDPITRLPPMVDEGSGSDEKRAALAKALASPFDVVIDSRMVTVGKKVIPLSIVVRESIAKPDNRYGLDGISWEQRGHENGVLVASDGNRLAALHGVAVPPFAWPRKRIIPRPAADMDFPMVWQLDSDLVRTGPVVTKLKEADFPDWPQVMPDIDAAVARLTLDKSDMAVLAQAIRAALKLKGKKEVDPRVIVKADGLYVGGPGGRGLVGVFQRGDLEMLAALPDTGVHMNPWNTVDALDALLIGTAAGGGDAVMYLFVNVEHPMKPQPVEFRQMINGRGRDAVLLQQQVTMTMRPD